MEFPSDKRGPTNESKFLKNLERFVLNLLKIWTLLTFLQLFWLKIRIYKLILFINLSLSLKNFYIQFLN